MDDVHHSEHWIAVRMPQEWLSTGAPAREAAYIQSVLDKVSRGDHKLQRVFAGEFLEGQHTGAEVEICFAETYQEVQSAIGFDLRRHLWGVGVSLLVGVVTLNLVMNTGLLAPLISFAAASRAIGLVDFGTNIPSIGMRELDNLANAFNRMSDQLPEVEQHRHKWLRSKCDPIVTMGLRPTIGDDQDFAISGTDGIRGGTG